MYLHDNGSLDATVKKVSMDKNLMNVIVIKPPPRPTNSKTKKYFDNQVKPDLLLNSAKSEENGSRTRITALLNCLLKN